MLRMVAVLVLILQVLGPCQSLPDGEEEVNSVSDFCQEFIQAQIHLQTLVRLSGPAINCPFTGKFTFTYKVGKYCHRVSAKRELYIINL